MKTGSHHPFGNRTTKTSRLNGNLLWSPGFATPALRPACLCRGQWRSRLSWTTC